MVALFEMPPVARPQVGHSHTPWALENCGSLVVLEVTVAHDHGQWSAGLQAECGERAYCGCADRGGAGEDELGAVGSHGLVTSGG
jgi:hypothetical protein